MALTASYPAEMLILGGSRGIGLAAAAHYAPLVGQLWSVSRGRSPFGTWIESDLATMAGVTAVAERLADRPLDALLYLGGTWERGAFTADYRFADSEPAEIERVVAVNLLAPIRLVRAVLPNLRRSACPRVVMIGALSGLDHSATREVANSAAKYGLRGAAQAMQRELGPLGPSFTVINPGNVATEEVLGDIAGGSFRPQEAIPLSDLLAVLDLTLRLSPSSYVAEINLAQTRPGASGG